MKKFIVCIAVFAALPAYAQIGQTMAQVRAARAAAVANPTGASTGTDASTADATNTSLTTDQRSQLQQSVYNACYQQAHMSVDMNSASQKLGTDVPKNYCTCMSDKLSQGVTDDDMKYIAQYKHMSPDLTKRFTANSTECTSLAQSK